MLTADHGIPSSTEGISALHNATLGPRNSLPLLAAPGARSAGSLGPAPLQKCVGDFCCANFGGFCRGFSWRIFLITFSHKNEKKSGDKIREKIRRPKNKNPRKIRSAKKRDPNSALPLLCEKLSRGISKGCNLSFSAYSWSFFCLQL